MPRPSDYKPEYAEQARKFCLLGAKDEQLATMFSVSVRTISGWKNKHPAFLQALKAGKEVGDAQVASSLYHRATGYEWDEEIPMKVKKVIYDNGKRVSETESVIMKKVHKIVPPDTTAAIFWLKNRNKENWRDRQELTGADGGPVEASTTVTFIPKQLPDKYWENNDLPQE
jgi:hypothetical protein